MGFYGSGTVPQKGDTRRVLLAKKLAALQALPGSLPANNEKRSDTIYRLRTRITNALNGTSTK